MSILFTKYVGIINFYIMFTDFFAMVYRGCSSTRKPADLLENQLVYRKTSLLRGSGLSTYWLFKRILNNQPIGRPEADLKCGGVWGEPAPA